MDILKNVVTQVTSTSLGSSIKALESIIQSDAKLLDLSTEMFTQAQQGVLTIPNNLATFFAQLNSLVRSAPAFSTERWASSPLTKFIEPYIRTPAGHEFFLDAKVNAAFHEILKEWGQFLRTPASAAVLTDGPNGWFSPEALSTMGDFENTFKCDSSKPHWGFTSWNDFFNRELREGARPIEKPDDPSVVVASVDGTTLRRVTDIKEQDEFWVKDQPYSLTHIFDGDPIAQQFVGGTIFQVNLEPTNYHRWHAPVSGTIVKIQEIDGAFCPVQKDSTSLDDWVHASQSYAVHTATRHLISIETETLGVVCCVFAGLLERGSCETTVNTGDYVKKGQQLGMFHFGGSTHAVVFGPKTPLQWNDDDIPQAVGQTIATLPIVTNVSG